VKSDFGLQLLPHDPEHLFLQVDRIDPAGLPDLFCEFTGEESRAAPEVKNPVPGLHVTFCKTFRVIESPPHRGVEMGGTGCGEHLMLVVFSEIRTGSHEQMLQEGRDNASGPEE